MHADNRGQDEGESFLSLTMAKFEDPYQPYYMTDGYTVYTGYMRELLGRPVKRVYKIKCWHTRKKTYEYDPRINYGQVVKTRDGNKLESVEYIKVAGEVPSEYFNTAAVERMNLTIRNGMARLKRISQTFSKSLEDLEQSCLVFRMVYNFCRPHMSLSAGRKKVTPAMAIGLADRVWSIRDLMTFSFRDNFR